jgi:hypothetical protein
MFILFIMFFTFIFFANIKCELRNIKKYSDFEKIIKNYDNVFIYSYDSEFVNAKNEKIFENHKKILNFLYEIIVEKEALGFSDVNLFTFDFSGSENSKFISFYNPSRIGEFLFLYREAIEKRILVESKVSKNDLINTIYENFEKQEKLKSKRWRRSRKQILFRGDKEQCSCNSNKTYITTDSCCYSAPRVGMSFGWGLPFCNWPGYWYGRGPCNFGCGLGPSYLSSSLNLFF